MGLHVPLAGLFVGAVVALCMARRRSRAHTSTQCVPTPACSCRPSPLHACTLQLCKEAAAAVEEQSNSPGVLYSLFTPGTVVALLQSQLQLGYRPPVVQVCEVACLHNAYSGQSKGCNRRAFSKHSAGGSTHCYMGCPPCRCWHCWRPCPRAWMAQACSRWWSFCRRWQTACITQGHRCGFVACKGGCHRCLAHMYVARSFRICRWGPSSWCRVCEGPYTLAHTPFWARLASCCHSP